MRTTIGPGLATAASLLALTACKPAAAPANAAAPAASGAPAASAAAAAAPAPAAAGQGFQVVITLSPAAASRLANPTETVHLDAEYYGAPLPAYVSQSAEGRLDVADNEDLEIPGAGVANFTGPKVDPSKVAMVTGGVIQVALSVYSGRHSSPDNILDCTDVMDTPLATLAAKPTVINCKLIGEGQ